jgi:hypothetical protein
LFLLDAQFRINLLAPAKSADYNSQSGIGDLQLQLRALQRFIDGAGGAAGDGRPPAVAAAAFARAR